MKKNYDIIDVLKFICAILVITIHTHPFREVNKTIEFSIANVLARIAVPFFFATAGYFFVKKIDSSENKKEVVTSYLKRLIILYIGWSAVYFYWDITVLYQKIGNTSLVIMQYIKNFVLFGSHFHLWYVVALIMAIVILYIAYISKKIKPFFIGALLLYIIGLMGDSYFGLIKHNPFLLDVFKSYFKVLGNTRNGIFFALPYVMMGAYIYLKPNKSKYNNIFTLLSFILLILEAFVLKYYKIPKDYNLYIMLIPFTYFFLNYLISLDFVINKSITYKARSYSMGLYFIHGVFLIMFDKIYKYIGLTHTNTVKFIFVLMSSLLAIWIIKKLNIPILRDLVK